MTAARRKRHPNAPPARRKGGAIDEQARRGGGLRRLPDLLGRVLDPAARRRGLAEAKLLTEWPSIVGPGLAARCQPVRLSQRSDRPGGVLLLHVAGPAALELQHSEPQVLERINGFFGYPAVSRLQLIQAPVKRAAARPAATPGSRLTSADETDLAAAVGTVGDPALQAALAALGRTLKLQVGMPLAADDTEPRPTGLG
jgi:hypothetical protein